MAELSSPNHHPPSNAVGGKVCALRRFLALVVIVCLSAAAAAWWWLDSPLPMGTDSVELSVEPGTTPRGVAQAVADRGVRMPPELLFAWFRLSGQARHIQAGSYEIDPRHSRPASCCKSWSAAKKPCAVDDLVEGWNLRQVREALARAPNLKPDSAAT